MDQLPDARVLGRRAGREVAHARTACARAWNGIPAQAPGLGAAARTSRGFIDPDNPNVLTIGFARRFATYKRAALIMRDRERLLRLVSDPERPVLFLFAGKAHPADHARAAGAARDQAADA